MELDMSPLHDTVSDDVAIWRYMDLPRFVSMLATRELWFAKAATYDDPYEGFCKAVPSAGHGHVLAQNAAEVCGNARDYLYVNSWCLAFESMAMWEIYGSRGCGLAVRSTVNQYRRAAKFDTRADQYSFGEVTYHHDLDASLEIQRDFSRGPIPVGSGVWPEVLKLGFNKRSAFKHENEWRAALYKDYRPEVSGVRIPFDLEQLISAVYVGPRAEAFFFDAVGSIMDKFLPLRKPLERSVLLNQPKK